MTEATQQQQQILLNYRFFSIIGYYKMLNIVPCAIQLDLVVYSVCNSLYLLISNSQSIPSPFPSLLGNTSLFFMSVSLFVSQIGSFVLYFISNIIYICLSLSDLFHLYSKSIHVSVDGIISFVLMAEQYSVVYVNTYHIFFIHSSVCGHLGCFVFGYCNWCCSEHWGACNFSNQSFIKMYAQEWDCRIIL